MIFGLPANTSLCCKFVHINLHHRLNKLSQRELADAIHVPYQRVNALVNKRRRVTPGTALRLARFLGVSADFWLNLPIRQGLYQAQQSEKEELKSIQDFHQRLQASLIQKPLQHGRKVFVINQKGIMAID